MESLKEKPNDNDFQEKLLYDINNSKNYLEDNEYCPHIQNHFLNPYMNSIFKKITISPPSNPAKPNDTNKKNEILYFHNLSLFQNPFKSHIHLTYPQSLNLFNSFLFKNLSLDQVLYSNPQNLPVNTMNNDGCIFSLNFNETGNIMTASTTKNLEIWDMSKMKLKKMLSDHKEIVTDVQFLHGEENNSNFLSCSLDKTIKLYKDFKNVFTFNEHSDWVRALSISYDNSHFLSGCVSSIVKFWDLNKKIVIGNLNNNIDNQNFMNTVNSLTFMRTNPFLFMVGLRSGDVKICDTRILSNSADVNNRNLTIVQSFKAHNEKLNTSKINQGDKYILTSGRDSSLRLWDLRKIYDININSYNATSNNNSNPNFINEYKKHKCFNYNVDCNFYNEEKYLLTGSETGSIFIYDIMNNNIYKEIKTHLKCINLVKEVPNCSNAFAFAGLAESAVFIYDSNKNISKFYEKEDNNSSDEEKYIFNDEDETKEDKTQELCNNIIEEIMKEYGDVILKAFHKSNMTYNSGLNFQNLLDVMQKSGDNQTFQNIQKIFIEKLMKSFSNIELNKKEKVENNSKKDIKNEYSTQKRQIKCTECQMNEKNDTKNENKIVENNNIFNSVDKEQLKQLLILPNNFEFNVINQA